MIIQKLLLRKILANKKANLLTLISLVVTFVGIITLTLFIDYELSFDKQHKNNIYHLKTTLYQDALPINIIELVEGKLTDVSNATLLRIKNEEVSLDYNDNTSFKQEQKLIYTDAHFLEMFNFEVASSSVNAVFNKPNQVLLTKQCARKFFGDEASINKAIWIKEKQYTVAGILYDVPKTSTIQFDMITSIHPIIEESKRTGEKAWGFISFLQLRPDAKPAATSKQIDHLLADIQPFKSLLTVVEDNPLFKLSAFKNIHFDTSNTVFSSSNPLIYSVLLVFVIMIIVMGLMNYINFKGEQVPYQTQTYSLLHFFGNSKRKGQFINIIESIIWCLISLCISLLIHQLFYNKLQTALNIEGLQINDRLIYIIYFILGAVCFGIAGSYWASKQIKNTPLSDGLKGKILAKNKTYLVRNILLTTQFTVAVTLTISVFVISKQLNFWYNFDTGISTDQVVQVKLPSSLKTQHEAFTNKITQKSLCADYALADQVPSAVNNGMGTGINDKLVNFKTWVVSKEFINFFNINIEEGRAFQTENDADLGKVIINKKAVAEINWPDEALGKTMSTGDKGYGEIIGVMNNIQINSLYSETGPLQLYLSDNSDDFDYLFLRVKPCNYKTLFNEINTVAKEFDPQANLEIEFVNEASNKLYAQEERMVLFIKCVTIWCIIIALIGMLSMTLLVAQNKTKEIGIRKINGASVADILIIINKQFGLIVSLSIVIAIPISYILMEHWLSNFTYRTNIGIWVYLVTSISTFLISIAVVSTHIIKVAKQNPIMALRCE
ncbi:ABC transporter permease [Saccharicrinis aurantiacus]|uniref:ABC transporter permease n=1 Tax=Saccharicrinis aurantiacus TaxID=1849719 RepID=UPI002492F403|nr:ABC transporter permease [Saccharicrinis aurantiacus]